MCHRMRAVLIKAGIAPQMATHLAECAISPPSGTFDPTELETAGDGRIVLLVAIIAARDYQRFHNELKTLLTFVKSAEQSISPFDRGRLLHLEGVAAWRGEDSAYLVENALNRSISVLRQLESPEAFSYLARVFDTFGQFLHRQGLLKDARSEFETALRYRQWERDESGIALTLGNLGRLCMDIGDFSAACDYLRRDLEIIERISPELMHLRAQLLSHLGTCHLEMGKRADAEGYFHRSSELSRKIQDHLGLFFGALGLGRAAMQEQDPSTAGDQVKIALKVLQKADISEALKEGLKGYVHQLSAELHLFDGEIVQAVDKFERAWAHLAPIPNFSPIEKAHLLRGYAKATRTCGEGEKSTQLLRQALRCLDSTTADSLRVTIEEELRDYSHDSWLLHSAGRFVGHQQIEFLLHETGRRGFRGSEKEMTILFSDIRGFTSFSEKFSPAELISFLNDYLGHMTRCVQCCGGTVDKFIGDAVMALFSLPESKGDDSDQAAMAALMMRSELKRFNRQLPQGVPKLIIGIGLHFGPVVAGLIGSPQKRSYTVIGDAVNTASRLEGMTKILGASTLISREVMHQLAVPDRYLLRPLGRYLPKGCSKPIDVFDLMGLAGEDCAASEIKLEIQKIERALGCFERREFPEALERFADLAADAAHSRREKGYLFLAEKTRELIEKPPLQAPWNSAISLTEK
jgi:class 3 adenylate cyclase